MEENKEFCSRIIEYVTEEIQEFLLCKEQKGRMEGKLMTNAEICKFFGISRHGLSVIKKKIPQKLWNERVKALRERSHRYLQGRLNQKKDPRPLPVFRTGLGIPMKGSSRFDAYCGESKK